MECELCGRNAQLVKAEVEGTFLEVCPNCLKLGRPEIPAAVPTAARSPRDPSASEINPDFAKIVKAARAREGLNITQLADKIREKASVVERVEKGMRPTDMLARKLEKALKIKLLGYEG